MDFEKIVYWLAAMSSPMIPAGWEVAGAVNTGGEANDLLKYRLTTWPAIATRPKG